MDDDPYPMDNMYGAMYCYYALFWGAVFAIGPVFALRCLQGVTADIISACK